MEDGLVGLKETGINKKTRSLCKPYDDGVLETCKRLKMNPKEGELTIYLDEDLVTEKEVQKGLYSRIVLQKIFWNNKRLRRGRHRREDRE